MSRAEKYGTIRASPHHCSFGLAGSFLPVHRFGKLDVLRSRWRLCRLTDAACPLRVHKVRLHFPNLVSTKNLSPNALAELCGAAPDSRLNCAVLPLTRACACCMVRCCPWHIFGGRRRVLRFYLRRVNKLIMQTGPVRTARRPDRCQRGGYGTDAAQQHRPEGGRHGRHLRRRRRPAP